MNRIPAKSARHLAHKAEARMVIILALAGGDYAVTSYGRRQSEDEAAKLLGDRIAGQLEDGTLANYQASLEGSDLRSLEGRAQKAIELLAQAIGGHGGATCPLGIDPCKWCRLAREWKAYTTTTREQPAAPARKRCTEDGCRRLARGRGELCSPCRLEQRAAAGLD